MSHQNINILIIPMGQISSAKIESKQMQIQNEMTNKTYNWWCNENCFSAFMQNVSRIKKKKNP